MKDSDQKVVMVFVSVGIRILAKCLNLLITATIFETRIKISPAMPAVLLPQRCQSTVLVKEDFGKTQVSAERIESETNRFHTPKLETSGATFFSFQLSTQNFLFKAHYFSTYLTGFPISTDWLQQDNDWSHTNFSLRLNSFSLSFVARRNLKIEQCSVEVTKIVILLIYFFPQVELQFARVFARI